MSHLSCTPILETHRRAVEQFQRAGGQRPGARTTLWRRLVPSLAGGALLLALGQGPALAATITVDGTCTLVDAITAANTDASTGGCAAGSGADTIQLPAGSTHALSVVNNTDVNGPTGLPVITSAITIQGNGSTIQRESSAPAFRILAVSSGGDLTLQDTTIGGGATFSARGGGVYNSGGTTTLTNSTVSGNNASASGGGVWNALGGVLLSLTRTLVSGNMASEGPEIFTPVGGVVQADNHNLFGHDNDAGVVGFTPGSTDVVPTVALSAILDPTLADNGGPTWTHALVPGSPAVDANPVDSDCQSFDQRNVSRPQGSACDIGAFELVQALPISIETITAFLDDAVTDGTLNGTGSGKSAMNRLSALQNQLVTAGDLLAQGEITEACDQLAATLQRIDLDGTPEADDFVTGSAADDLAGLIADLRAAYGCE